MERTLNETLDRMYVRRDVAVDANTGPRKRTDRHGFVTPAIERVQCGAARRRGRALRRPEWLVHCQYVGLESSLVSQRHQPLLTGIVFVTSVPLACSSPRECAGVRVGLGDSAGA